MTSTTRAIGGSQYAAAQTLHAALIRRPSGFTELMAALRLPDIGLGHLADKMDPPLSNNMAPSTGIVHDL